MFCGKVGIIGETERFRSILSARNSGAAGGEQTGCRQNDFEKRFHCFARGEKLNSSAYSVPVPEFTMRQ